MKGGYWLAQAKFISLPPPELISGNTIQNAHLPKATRQPVHISLTSATIGA